MDKLKQFAELKFDLFNKATGADAKAAKIEAKPPPEDGANQPELHAKSPESAPEASGAPFNDGKSMGMGDAPFDDSVMEDNLLWSAHYTYDEFVNALTVSYEDRGDSLQEKRHWSYPRRWRVKLENMHIINGTADPLTCFAEFDFGGTRSECRVQLGTGTCILNKGETKNYIRTPVVPDVNKDVARPILCSHTFEYRGSYLDLEYEKLRIKLWRYRKYTINTLESIYEAPLLKFAKSDVKVEIPLYKTVKQQRILRCRISFDLYFEELYDFELCFLNWRIWDIKSSRDLLKEAKSALNEASVGQCGTLGESGGVKGIQGLKAVQGGALKDGGVSMMSANVSTVNAAQAEGGASQLSPPVAHKNPSLLQKVQYYFNRHKMEKNVGGAGQHKKGGQPVHNTGRVQGNQRGASDGGGVQNSQRVDDSQRVQGGALKNSKTATAAATTEAVKGSAPEPQTTPATQHALKATKDLPPCEYTTLIEQQMLAFKSVTANNTSNGTKVYLPSPRLHISIKTDNGLTRKNALKLSSILQRSCKSCHWENVGILVFRGTLMDLYKAQLEISIYDTGTLRAAVCVGQASIPLVGIVDYPHVRSVLSKPDWLALKANVEGWWPALQRWLFGHLSGSIVINRRPRYRQATTKLGLTLKSSPVMLVVTVVGIDQLLCDVLERVDTIDSYVQVSFNGLVHCTSFCRKSATPSWNEDVLIPFVLGDGETLGASNLLNKDPIYFTVWGHFSDGLDHQQTIYFGGACLYMHQLFYNSKGMLLPRVKKTLANASTSGGSSLYDRMFDVRVYSGALKLEGLSKESQHQQSSLTVSAWIHPNVSDDKLPTTIDLSGSVVVDEDSCGSLGSHGTSLHSFKSSGGTLGSSQGSALNPSKALNQPTDAIPRVSKVKSTALPSSTTTNTVTRFDTRRLLAPKMRQVFEYLCNDWRRVVALKRPKNPELSNAYLIDTQAHSQVYLSCLISPLYPPGDYETCNAIFHMIRCIPFVRKNTNVVYTPDFFMKLGSGGAIDHAILHVCYLRGLFPPVDAFVCLGTLKDKRPHAWVAVVDSSSNGVTFYDSISGTVWRLDSCVGVGGSAVAASDSKGVQNSRGVHDSQGVQGGALKNLKGSGGALESGGNVAFESGGAASRNSTSTGATAAVSNLPLPVHRRSLSKLPFETIHIMFNERNVWLNVQQGSMDPRRCWYDVDDYRCWYAFSTRPHKVRECFVPRFSLYKITKYQLSLLHVELHKHIERALTLYRSTHNLHTRWNRDESLAEFLQAGLEFINKRDMASDDNVEYISSRIRAWKRRLGSKVPPSHYLYAAPFFFNRCHPDAIADALVARVPLMDSREPCMTFAMSLLVSSVPGNFSSVYVLVVVVYRINERTRRRLVSQQQRLALWRSKRSSKGASRGTLGADAGDPGGCGGALEDLRDPDGVSRVQGGALENLKGSGGAKGGSYSLKDSRGSGGALGGGAALMDENALKDSENSTDATEYQDATGSSTDSPDLDDSSATSDVDATPNGTPSNSLYKTALKSSLVLDHSKAKQLAQQTSRLKALQTRDLMNVLDENLNLQDENLTRMATRGVGNLVSIYKSGDLDGDDKEVSSCSSASDILKHLQSDASLGDLKSKESARVHFKDLSESGGTDVELESDLISPSITSRVSRGSASSFASPRVHDSQRVQSLPFTSSRKSGGASRVQGGALESGGNVALDSGVAKRDSYDKRDSFALTEDDDGDFLTEEEELISPSLSSRRSKASGGALTETASLISEPLGNGGGGGSWTLSATSRVQNLAFTSSRESGGASRVEGEAQSESVTSQSLLSSRLLSGSPSPLAYSSTGSLVSGPVDYKPAIVSNMAKELLKNVEADVVGSGGVAVESFRGSGGALSESVASCDVRRLDNDDSEGSISNSATFKVSSSTKKVLRSSSGFKSSVAPSDGSATIISDPLGSWRSGSLKSLRSLHTASIHSESLTSRASVGDKGRCLEALSRAVDVARGVEQFSEGNDDSLPFQSQTSTSSREYGGALDGKGVQGAALEGSVENRYVNELATLLKQDSEDNSEVLGFRGEALDDLKIPTLPSTFSRSCRTSTQGSQSLDKSIDLVTPPRVHLPTATSSSATSSPPITTFRTSARSSKYSQALPAATSEDSSSWLASSSSSCSASTARVVATTTSARQAPLLNSVRSSSSTSRSPPLPSVVEDFLESSSASSKVSYPLSTLSSALEPSGTVYMRSQASQASRKDTEASLVSLQWNQSIPESSRGTPSIGYNSALEPNPPSSRLDSVQDFKSVDDSVYRRRGRLPTIGTGANLQNVDNASKLSRQETETQQVGALVSFDDLVTVRTVSNVSATSSSLFTMLSSGNATQVSDLESARMVADSLLDKVQSNKSNVNLNGLAKVDKDKSVGSWEKFNVFQSYL